MTIGASSALVNPIVGLYPIARESKETETIMPVFPASVPRTISTRSPTSSIRSISSHCTSIQEPGEAWSWGSSSALTA